MHITEHTYINAARFFGAGIAMGLGAIGSAVGEGIAAGTSVAATSRQPKSADVTYRTMLLGQALAETPGIFSLVIALLLAFTDSATHGLHHVGMLIGSGLAIGLSAVGSGVGLGLATSQACDSVGRNPRARPIIQRTMILGMAITESPCIFAFVTSLILLLVNLAPSDPIAGAIAYMSAALCVGIGTIGSCIGEGYAASVACRGVGRYPLAAGALNRTMILGQAIAESPAVFTLVISMILIFVAP